MQEKVSTHAKSHHYMFLLGPETRYPSGNIPFTSLAQVLGRGVCRGAGRDDFGLNLRCERMTSFKLYFSFKVSMALTSKIT